MYSYVKRNEYKKYVAYMYLNILVRNDAQGSNVAYNIARDLFTRNMKCIRFFFGAPLNFIIHNFRTISPTELKTNK